MKKSLLYIHGKGGSAAEVEHYKALFADYELIGLDYQGKTPWDTKKEFLEAYNQLSGLYDSISIVANSIGAYFAMNAWGNIKIDRAFFISPIVNMEKLIIDIMKYADIGEQDLAKKGKIKTSWGDVLSWKYLCYVRENPIVWKVPTDILYGENDNLTSFDAITTFAKQHHATLIVMPNGEHWFHTEEQMNFLDDWLIKCLKKEK